MGIELLVFKHPQNLTNTDSYLKDTAHSKAKDNYNKMFGFVSCRSWYYGSRKLKVIFYNVLSWSAVLCEAFKTQ